MRIRSSVLATVALLIVTGLSPGRTALAQDVVKVAPQAYKVLFENSRVRVLEYRGKPGDRTPMHSHPAYLVYAFDANAVKFTASDGTVTERTSKAGQVNWNDGETHSSENVGKHEAHVLIVELKEAPKAP